MKETVEINHLDTRYEHLRLKDKRREQILLSSILEQGIVDPLYVINLSNSSSILLDGFKRYRCAAKLSLQEVPVTNLDNNEAMGILKFIRLCSSKGMNILEEAGLVDELHQRHEMSMAEISRRLERSLTWVSVRLGMLSEMSADVREKIFSGKFPVRSYMYTLRHFTRVKYKGGGKEVESFVNCVSGKQYSTRDIELLAGAWFKGGKILKTQMKQGNLDWTLRQLKKQTDEPGSCDNALNAVESRVLSNLEIASAYLFKLMTELKGSGLKSDEFFERSGRCSNRLIKMLHEFEIILKEFYDRCRQKAGGTDTVQVRQR